MFANIHALGHGTRLTLPAMRNDEGLAVLVGGRGTSVRLDGAVAGVWLPLRGHLQLSVGDGETVHYRGGARVVCADAGMQAVGRAQAVWLALIGPPAAWHRLLAAEPTRGAGLLSASYEIDRALLRRVLALGHAMRSGDAVAALKGLIDEIATMQERFDEVIARCPGRTWAQRRQVFLRLQRVHEHLMSNCHLDLDNEALARIASYSPWHFIRAFHAAYRETPHAFLVSQRLRRAQHMLCTSPLAIGEIALACGFENRCAFSRLFRQRYGMTASSLRRRAAFRAAVHSAA